MSSTSTLVALSVVEIVALVAVLAFFLVVLTKMLSHVAGNLHAVSNGVQSIEGHLTILAAVPMVNKTLDEIANALPVVAKAANAKAARR
jgi:predicted aminopeptidase